MVHMDEEDKELKSTGDYASSATHDINSIILYPFAHQVGGHTQLLTLDKSTLCKPLIPRELLFYLNVPKELARFVPSYKGVVQIKQTTGTYPSIVYQPLRSSRSPHSKYGPGSSCTLPSKLGAQLMSHSMLNNQSMTDLCGSSHELKVQIRQCSDEKILKKNMSEDNLLKADYISRPNENYLLLLENVASKYQLPCILDLKMGTRQHGDDATEEKRHRQIAKCQASTSASLGVRLCGMQVYQVDYGGFLWYDKYYGRKMDEEGLKQALHQYFHNGFQLNEDMIDDVIARLKLLSIAVENSPSFRFYGTSLLIIHEGCTSRSSKRCPVDVRLIDFAHTICDYSNTSARGNPSSSVLKSSSAEQLTVSSPILNDPSLKVQQNFENKTYHEEEALVNENNNNPLNVFISVKQDSSDNEGVDMSSMDIDRQQQQQQPQQQQSISNPTTTQSHTGARKISKPPTGPDNGLLFGLENLMRLLDDLKSQYHDQEKQPPIKESINLENLKYIPECVAAAR